MNSLGSDEKKTILIDIVFEMFVYTYLNKQRATLGGTTQLYNITWVTAYIIWCDISMKKENFLLEEDKMIYLHS